MLDNELIKHHLSKTSVSNHYHDGNAYNTRINMRIKLALAYSYVIYFMSTHIEDTYLSLMKYSPQKDDNTTNVLLADDYKLG